MIQEINWFNELFLSTDLWGWFGPLGLIVISFIILANKKYRPLGIFFLVVESLLIYTYLDLFIAGESWYIWNIIILVFGWLTCMVQMIGR